VPAAQHPAQPVQVTVAQPPALHPIPIAMQLRQTRPPAPHMLPVLPVTHAPAAVQQPWQFEGPHPLPPLLLLLPLLLPEASPPPELLPLPELPPELDPDSVAASDSLPDDELDPLECPSPGGAPFAQATNIPTQIPSKPRPRPMRSE
jgi:hypothetical protein